MLHVLADLYGDGLTVIAPMGTGEHYERNALRVRWREYQPLGSSLADSATRFARRTAYGWLGHFNAQAFGRYVLEFGRAHAEVAALLANTLVECAGRPVDVVLSRIDHAMLVRLRAAGQRWIVDTNDLMHRLFNVYGNRQLAAAGWRRAAVVRSTQRWERRELARFDKVVAISEYDFDWLRSAGVPRVVLEEQCVVPIRDDTPVEPRYDVGFLGAAHRGSHGAAVNLIRGAARRGRENVRVAVGGSVCAMLNGHTVPANVRMLGRVESASGFWRQCRYAVLISGGETGTSVKFQEALLAGTRVLANRDAARWSIAIPGRDYVSVEDTDDALDRVAANDPCGRISNELMQIVSYPAVVQRWESHLDGAAHAQVPDSEAG